MAPRRPPERIDAYPEYEIPADICREIGRIMVRWAYFEQSVRRTIWGLMDVDERMGRLAVRDPRIDDRIEMIPDLAYLRGVKIDEARIKKLVINAREILKYRDLLAHGIWVRHKGKWFLQMIGGNNPADFVSVHRKRRISPEALEVQINNLRACTEAIEAFIEIIGEIREELREKLQGSPQAPPL
jgi:hypothetical protein